MADDIDIEEHDVLDNPTIKSIFPDISMLKKEISNFFDDGQEVKREPISITAGSRQRVIFEDPVPDASTNINYVDIHKPEKISLTSIAVNSNTKTKGNSSVNPMKDKEKQFLHSNKIILGSKPNKLPQYKKDDYFERYKKCQVKVLLKNLGPSLNRNTNYCKICLILFPNKLALNAHKTLVHSKKIAKASIINNSMTVKSNEAASASTIKKSNAVKSSKKPKCSLCFKLFSSQGNLLRHYKNIHHRKLKIVTKKTDESNSIGLNLRRKCKDPKQLIDNPNHTCSHCQKSFPNKQSLIEHMYNILQHKKRVTINNIKLSTNEEHPKTPYCKPKIMECDDNEEITTNQKKTYKHSNSMNTKCKARVKKSIGQLKRTKENVTCHSSSKRPINNAYRCPICSYYLTTTKYYLTHMLKKHKVNQTSAVKRESFDSHCKFCPSKFDAIIPYNRHMYKCHRARIEEISSQIKINTNTEHGHLVIKQKSKVTQQLDSESRKNCENIKVIKTFAYKSILFKCDKCDIHFLSAETATKHSQHMDILINWKCETCRRIFKKNDGLLHNTQHYFSDEFVVYDISETTLANFLFKCPKCAVHFTEDIYVNHHYPSCDIKTPNSVYCKSCDILISHDMVESHKYCHRNKNSNSSHFTIVESAIMLDNVNEDIALDKEKNEKSPITLKTKPITMDNRRPSQIWASKTWDELEEFENSNSTNGNGSITGESISSKAWSTFMLYISYCNTCKTFVSNMARKRKAHTQSLCAHIVKYVCKLCGLVLTNKAITTHRNLHKTRNNLKLQDYKFYDMDGNQICPPIPEYPHCDICGVHFLNKVAVISHSCSEAEYLTCDICQIKLSEAAHKLHMSFHNYKIKKRKKPKLQAQTSKSPTTDLTGQKSDTQERSQLKSQTLQNSIKQNSTPRLNMTENSECETIKHIYLCKSCGINVTCYDKMIKHCQKHYNEIEYKCLTKKCNDCCFNFDTNDYENHQKLHLHNKWDISIIKVFSFDILYFTSDNKVWIQHLFRSLSKDEIQEIVSKSIYRFEHRIKLEVTQSGPVDLTVYKCDRCRSFVDPISIFKHADNVCNAKIKKHPCPICGLSFISNSSRTNHGKIHKRPNIGLKSYNIVTFNKDEDTTFNKNILSSRNRYILYQCRNCDGIVNNRQFETHPKCNRMLLSKCNKCGLLIHNEEYESHAAKHNNLDNFNDECMKVILFGRIIKKDKPIINDELVPSFTGTVLDYKFYKCFKCEICVDDKKSIQRHICLFGDSKSKCPKCPVRTPSNKLHRHLKLHESELEFIKENMYFVIFNINSTKEQDAQSNKITNDLNEKMLDDKRNPLELKDNEIIAQVKEKVKKKSDAIQIEANSDAEKGHDMNIVVEKVVNIFRCLCGLHFLEEISGRGHSSHCNLKMKVSKQNCSKCDLLFTPSELFNHLLNHHGDKSITYKFNIIQLCHKYDNKPTLFNCSKCNLHFIKPHEVNKHYKVCEGAGNAGKICNKCNFVYDTRSYDENRHNEECQKDYKLNVINSSPPGFSQNESIVLQYNNLGNSALQIDTSKDTGFNISREILLKIDLSKYNNTIYKCKVCNIHLLNEDSMKKHHILCKLKKFTKLCHVLCKICGLNFSLQNVGRHTFIHHEKLRLEANDIIIKNCEDCVNSSVHVTD